jgi:hypothetical protein
VPTTVDRGHASLADLLQDFVSIIEESTNQIGTAPSLADDSVTRARSAAWNMSVRAVTGHPLDG